MKHRNQISYSSRIFLVWAGIALSVTGCSGARHGYTLLEYEGHILLVNPGSSGAQRLQIESDYDPTIRHFVEQNGEPDYIYVADRQTVQLIYVNDDRVIMFQRPWWNTASDATVTDGIPDGLTRLFTSAHQNELAANRSKLILEGSTPNK